jgi:ferritin-like metal-binding protein YciE
MLAEAHANELALVNTLEAHIRIAERGSYRSLLQEHLRETNSHATQIKRRLDRLGYNESLVGRGYALAQNVLKQSLVLAKGPVDMIRGGTDVYEKMLRNARDEVMTEGMEISTYDSIESLARGLGDGETAELAAMIRLDEEQMLDALRKEIPVLADLVVTNTLIDGDRRIDEPWTGYDDMTADEIKSKLSDASISLLTTVRSYEQANKNRTTVIEATERETANA